LKTIVSFSIPRHYFGGKKVMEVSLHTFSDASTEAYAAVSYIRSVDTTGVQLTMVGAKARVAPLKVISISRLELMAAVLGYRLTMKITRLLKIEDVVYWTDSMNVFHWVRGHSRTYKTVL
jgi:hypothetical protein